MVTAAWLRSLARTVWQLLRRRPEVLAAGRKADLAAQVLAYLTDAARVRDVVDAAPAQARDLLHEVAEGNEVRSDRLYSTSYDRRLTPQGWAVARGLLMRTSQWGGELVMPAEVALALRGPAYTAPFEPAGCQALLATGDLQGVAASPQPPLMEEGTP